MSFGDPRLNAVASLKGHEREVTRDELLVIHG